MIIGISLDWITNPYIEVQQLLFRLHLCDCDAQASETRPTWLRRGCDWLFNADYPLIGYSLREHLGHYAD